MTLTSIALPQWLTYSSPTDYSPNPNRPSAPIKISYGLHKRCSSLSGTCSDFPTFEDCHGSDERYFCSMWRTVGFLMSFSVVIEFATVVAFAVVLVGGRQYREIGWKMCVGMLSVVAASQCAGMAIVVSRRCPMSSPSVEGGCCSKEKIGLTNYFRRPSSTTTIANSRSDTSLTLAGSCAQSPGLRWRWTLLDWLFLQRSCSQRTTTNLYPIDSRS